MMAETCRDFTKNRIVPAVNQLEKHDHELLKQLMKEAGELGLLGISVPEEYDGFGQNFVTSMLTTEAMGAGFSFSVAYSAHTGIGTLPILYFGNEEQKKKYLPRLTSGDCTGAYALTEPNAGSDANSGKTKATLTDDGKHYLINGQKMWITNGGVADLFIVFAKIDDDKNLSAFIVEKDFGGIVINPEEEKLGIKGSSTTQLFFENCKVPVENLLNERGFGFKIALYVLNIGRIKLAGAVNGAAKESIGITAEYANERKQFGISIGRFGAIKHKIGEQVIRTFGSVSATYRASQNIDDLINSQVAKGIDKNTAAIEAIKEFAIEDAMLKVYASEALDYVVDESVQVHGGMGYSAETLAEKGYRDARINRIFEGTNEINRLLSVDMVLKRAMNGELDIMGPAMSVADELLGIPDFADGSESYFEEKRKYLVNFKKAILLIAGGAAQKFMEKLAHQQEIIMNIADMAIQTYIAESALLRVEKLAGMRGEEAVSLYKDVVDVLIYDAASTINKAGVDAINAFAEGDEQTAMLMGMKRFTKVAPINTVVARRRIADKTLEDNKYPF